jgi:hypothetical protein
VGAGIRHGMQALDEGSDIRPDLQHQVTKLIVILVDPPQAPLLQFGFDVFVHHFQGFVVMIAAELRSVCHGPYAWMRLLPLRRTEYRSDQFLGQSNVPFRVLLFFSFRIDVHFSPCLARISLSC